MHKLRKNFKKAKNYFTFIVGVYFLCLCVRICVCIPVHMAFIYVHVPVCMYMFMFICHVYKYACACCWSLYVLVHVCVVCVCTWRERCTHFKMHTDIILLSSKFMPVITLLLKVLYSAE